MLEKPCMACQDILDRKANKKHSDIQRSGLSKSVGYHGSRDDEYVYVCKACETRFIGDSMGIWPDNNN